MYLVERACNSDNDMRMGSEFRRFVRRTRIYKDDAGDVDLELFFDNVLENSSVDEEWLRMMNGSVGFGLLSSILMFEIPVPLEFLCSWSFLVPSSARHE